MWHMWGAGEVHTGFWWGCRERPEGRRPLRRPKHSGEDNSKMDLKEVGCGGIDWIDLAQDRYRWLALVNAVMNLRVP